MNIEEIYKNVDRIILKHLMINDDAMKICQSLGYNGFKRMHRVNSRKLLNNHLELENNMFDKYRLILNTNVEVSKYDPVNIKNHLDKWKQALEEDIKQLGNLNYKHMETVGISNNIIESLICLFIHDYEKTSRWYARFNESNWNPIDMHAVDDRLHEKIKQDEERE